MSATNLFSRRAARVLLIVPLVAVAAVAMSGCSPAPSATPSSSAAVTRTPFPSIKGAAPVSLTCENLATAAPGWNSASTLSPGPGTPARAAQSINGAGCVFEKGSGHRLLLAVSRPTNESVRTLEKYFQSQNLRPTDAFGGHGYWDLLTGDAEYFRGGYWISAVSDSFDQADARQVVEDTVKMLHASSGDPDDAISAWMSPGKRASSSSRRSWI